MTGSCGLSPTSPLFREARYLLADEPDLHDIGLYHSVLAAIASGNTHRGAIASYLGRKSGDLAHPLTVLQNCGLLTTRGRHGAADSRLVCYGGNGFTDDLRRAADQDNTVVLVTVDDLYRPTDGNSR
jgi:hypothetical protein